jgi:hypothetical protein
MLHAKRNDEAPTALVAQNWKYLYNNLNEAISALSFDAIKEPMPKDKLSKAKAALRKIEERITDQRITRLGRFNVRSEIGYVINSINGVRQGIVANTMTDKRVNEVMQPLVSRLRTVSVEITVRAEREAMEFSSANLHAQAASKRTEEQNLAIAAKTGGKTKEVKNASLFTNVQDAMKVLRENNIKQAQQESERMREEKTRKEKADEDALMEAIRRNDKERQEFPGITQQEEVPFHRRSRDYKPTKEEELQDAAKNRERLGQKTWHVNLQDEVHIAPEEKDTWVIRDQKNIEQVRTEFMPDMKKMQAALKKANLHGSNSLNWTLLRGPVTVISPAPPSKRALDQSGVSYTTIFRPSPRPAVGFSFKKEYNPPIIIFRDQVLIAIGTLPTPKKKPLPDDLKRRPIIRAKPAIESVTYSDEDISLLRRDLCDTLGVKLGGGVWLDILEENKGSKSKFIVDRNFPHVRFLWFIKRSIYAKLGPFTIQTAGFPF